MTATSWVFLWLNLAGAMTSFVVCIWAGVNTGGYLRSLFNIIAGMALLYTAAFVWLMFHPEREAEWSQFLRPISFLAWIVAWILEPIVITVDFRRKAKALQVATNRMIEGNNMIDLGERFE